MTATQLEKVLNATKLCTVRQFAADYNELHNAHCKKHPMPTRRLVMDVYVLL